MWKMNNNFIDTLSRNIITNKEFMSDYKQILKLELINQDNQIELSYIQIKRLIETASIFSLSNEVDYKKIALKISYMLFKYGSKYQELYDAIEIVLAS